MFGINSKIIKCIENYIFLPLTKLINMCIKSAVFPEVLKTARVVPVHKKGSVDSPDNYRPISLLPLIGKVFEKILKLQIDSYLVEHDILNGSQFGFRRGMSTALAISDLVEFIYDNFEANRISGAVFCDLSKAFDCVSHGLLLKKLRYYGFNSHSVDLIASYLLDRQQFVSLHGAYSSTVPVIRGVPQGSVLGPILFLIYINDLAYCMPDVKFTLFADDTTVITSNVSFTELGGRVCGMRSGVEDWFSSNWLSLNAAKTETMLFTLRLPYIFDNSVKFLGVILDPKLNWNSHVDYVSGKVAKNVCPLRAVVAVVSVRVALMAYHALIESLLRYAILSWGHAPAAKRLFKLQRRAIRVVAGLGWRTDCRGSFRQFRLLTLPCMYILECLRYARINTDSYSLRSDIHDHDTRGSVNLTVPFHRISASRSGLTYFAPLLFNSLPPLVRQLPLKKFVVHVREHLLLRAYYSVQECLDDRFSNIGMPSNEP